MTKSQAKGVSLIDRLTITATGDVGTVYAVAGDAEDAERLSDGCDAIGDHGDATALRAAAEAGFFPIFYVLDGYRDYRWHNYRDVERAPELPKTKKRGWRRLN